MSKRTRTTRFKPWMCVRCGYMMDAASHATKDVAPTEKDLSICLNCAALYQLRAGKWVAMSAEERAQLPWDARQEVLRHELAQRAVVKHDLAKQDKRT